MVSASSLTPLSSAKLGLIYRMETNVALSLSMFTWPKTRRQYLLKVLVTIHHQTSFVFQSTTAVSGMTLVALGEMSAQMTTSVALLMNTTYICMDHSRRVVFYLLDRSLLTLLDNVLLVKATVIGMVSIYIDLSFLNFNQI